MAVLGCRLPLLDLDYWQNRPVCPALRQCGPVRLPAAHRRFFPVSCLEISMSRAAQSLFPHQKLDWTISRLQERVDATPDDPTARIELAGAMVSRGLYHGR